MIKQNQKVNQSQVVLKRLRFCLLFSVTPKPKKQNQEAEILGIFSIEVAPKSVISKHCNGLWNFKISNILFGLVLIPFLYFCWKFKKELSVFEEFIYFQCILISFGSTNQTKNGLTHFYNSFHNWLIRILKL